MAPGSTPTGIARALLWSVDRRAQTVCLTLQGDIDENASLGELLPTLEGELRIDLAGIRRINSAGIREWVNFVREAKTLTHRITLSRCSTAMVMQMNMIANFRGEAEVESIYAPYACPRCDREEDILIPIRPELPSRLPARLPSAICPACGEALELDDIPERYFAFLKRTSA